mgnify:FL=1
MPNVTVIGCQWGDEGKGKIVDWLSNIADVVVRFQGGHNAGHTIVLNNNTYKLSLLPSGIIRGKLSIIGSGVVVDPLALINEIDTLKKQGLNITPKLLKISNIATLILPYHQLMDEEREKQKGKNKIGTTGRGIGPAYEDKIGRRAIRICDLYDQENRKILIKNALAHHNLVLKGLGEKLINIANINSLLDKVAPILEPFVDDTFEILHKKNNQGKNILFEGAQGSLLDIDYGTYPYVTSSNTIAPQAAIGSGIGPANTGYILGISKAYTTRVGNGPFPTELSNELGEKLRTKGNEFGVVTGRKRRCGWLDSVLLKYAVKLSSINGIALTKLDVLDSFKEIKICVGYRLGDKKLKTLPKSLYYINKVKPIYETLMGWNESTRGIVNLNKLPKNALKYIKRLEELIDTNISLLSTSPEREDTILIKNPFINK